MINAQIEAIRKDLISRKMVISAVTAIGGLENEYNEQVIMYNTDGIVSFVSPPYPIIGLYGKVFGNNLIHGIADVYSKRAHQVYKEKKAEENKKKTSESSEDIKEGKLKYILSLKWMYNKKNKTNA